MFASWQTANKTLVITQGFACSITAMDQIILERIRLRAKRVATADR